MRGRWYDQFDTGDLRPFRALPKVELHRHLEGSLRLETLFEIARAHQITVPTTHFQTLVQVQKDDPYTIDNFLSKFQMLRQFYRSPEIIARVAHEAVADAASDNIRYLELRFTPIALARLQGFSLAEVMDWVIESAMSAARERGVLLRLIASVNRHEPVELAGQVAELAAERIPQGVVGLDLAGDEAHFPALSFAPVFQQARAAGLHITAHAGEWGGPANVRQVIEQLGAERVGHGVRVIEDPAVVALAVERGTTFEVCLTSNYQSGVVAALTGHPMVRMLNAGLKVTLNTDDPAISGILLSDEYRLAVSDLGLPLPMLRDCILQAAYSSFLPEEDAARLAELLRPQLTAMLG